MRGTAWRKRVSSFECEAARLELGEARRVSARTDARSPSQLRAGRVSTDAGGSSGTMIFCFTVVGSFVDDLPLPLSLPRLSASAVMRVLLLCRHCGMRAVRGEREGSALEVRGVDGGWLLRRRVGRRK